MSSQSLQPPEADSPRTARPGSARRFQVGIRGLIVAVACFGLITWAGRSVWESQHPAVGAARGLQSTDPADRVGAARLLSSLGLADPDRAIPPLIDALGDPDAEVRSSAAASLGAIGGHLLRSGSAGPLVRTGVGALVAALKDREPSVRIAAISALHSIAPSKVAAEAIDLPSMIEAVAATLGDRDGGVRQAAVFALRHLAPQTSSGPPAPLVGALDDGSADVRAAAIKALPAFPVDLDPWLDLLLRGLEQGEPEVRTACSEAFYRYSRPPFSADAIPRLVKAMGSPDRRVRSHATRALYDHAGDPRVEIAFPALLAVLREPIDPEIERSVKPGQVVVVHDQDPAIVAADMLGRLAPGTKSAGAVIAALTEVVQSGHPSRRSSSAWALGEFGPAAESAIPVLIRAVRGGLANQGQDLRNAGWSAARVLGRIAPGTQSADEAVAALTETLELRPEIPSELRLMALDALGAFGPAATRAIPRLRECQKSADLHLKLAVERALASIGEAGPGQAAGKPGR